MTDSQIIQYYTDLYEKGQGSLSGLWYNIQTSLINLRAKEQRLQVQEERFQAQERKIQEQAAKIQEQERQIKNQEFTFQEYKRDFDIYYQHIIEKEAESCEYEKKETALRAEISDLKDELDSLKAEGVGIEEDVKTETDTWIEKPETYHHGNNINKNASLVPATFPGNGNVVEWTDAVDWAKYETIGKEAKGFTLSKVTLRISNTNRYEERIKVWFHSEIDEDKIGYEGKRVKRCRINKHIGSSLYILQ